MSKMGFCKNDLMRAIIVSNEELESFSDAINGKSLDEVIPLPNLTIEQQKAMLSVCVCDGESKYWENEDGGHGWCCNTCGTVTQWG